MKKIHYYEVKILQGQKGAFKDEIREIVAENDLWIVINTRHYEKITKSDVFEFSHCMPGKARIFARANEKVLDNGVFYLLYTFEPRTHNEIKTEIREFLKKNYEFLENVDLSFIR